MDSHLKKGRLFKTFDEVKTWIADLEKRQGQHYTRFRSKTLEAVKLKRIINPELIYYSLFYKCQYGGSFKSKGKDIRQRKSMKIGCPAFFKMAVSKDGQFLTLTEFNEEHNHENTERTESQTTSAQSHESTTEKADESTTGEESQDREPYNMLVTVGEPISERASVTEMVPGECVGLFDIGMSYEICSEAFGLSFESKLESDQLVNMIAQNDQADEEINASELGINNGYKGLAGRQDYVEIKPQASTSVTLCMAPSTEETNENHASDNKKTEIASIVMPSTRASTKSETSTSVTLCRAPSAEKTKGTEKIVIEPEQINASESGINIGYTGLAERQDDVEQKSQASTSVTLFRAASAEETKENHAPDKITEITSIVMPSTRASRGRPKGSVLTAIGLPKKGRPISFAKKTNKEKLRYLLSSLFTSDMAKNIAKKEYVVTANDITDDMDSLPDVVADDMVDLKILRPYFERAAFQKLSKLTKTKKKADKFSCAVCQTLIVTNCVVCDCCLKWYHYKCVALKKAPRTETWYCPSCSKL